MAVKNCPQCGAPTDVQGSFCGNCGYAFREDRSATSLPPQREQGAAYPSPYPPSSSLFSTSSPTYSGSSTPSSPRYQAAGSPPPPPPPFQAANSPSAPIYQSVGTPPPPPLSSLPSSPVNGVQFPQAATPKNEPDMPPLEPRRKGRKGVIAILALVLIIILASAVGIYEFASHNKTTGTPSSTPTTASTNPVSNSSSPTAGASTPTTGAASPAPGTTATGTVQPSATVVSGVAVKNLTLPCSQCASVPVRVTINSVQVDTPNGRMIWDTALKDVTGSNSGFQITQYSLEASGSTTQVNAVLSQSQFSGNNADIQAIFAFVPSPGTTYTLTVVVQWAYNNANNINFDPIQISFAANGTPTAVLPQPSPTATAGSITKNLTLACSQCASDPVRVTISTIQIDTANGRMIWNTSLRDVTNSNSGFQITQYSLEASGSTTQVNAVLSQSQFSGNQADMQAIFAFVPTPGVTYTLTIIVQWAYNNANNINFDPVQISF